MKIYLAILDDPDDEPAVSVFDTPEKAIAYAKQLLAEQACPTSCVKERDTEGRLYCCSIGEGFNAAHLYVIEQELNA